MYTRPMVRRWVAGALWAPILVGLSYLPDITAQLVTLTGVVPVGGTRVATHSVVFAVGGTLLFGLVLGRAAGIGLARGLLIAGLCIAGHVLLDFLQGSDSYPLWPLSRQPIDLPWQLIPVSMRGEVTLLGGISGALIAGYAAFRLVQEGKAAVRSMLAGGRLAWGARALIVLILAAALGTHYLREERAQQLDTAWLLIRKGRSAEALPFIDRADHWPRTAGAGRIEYMRGAAYEGLGDRRRAEAWYLRAIEADPGFYWALADLTELYANSREPLAGRRRRVEPCVALLKERFPKSGNLPELLKRLGRKLGPAATQVTR